MNTIRELKVKEKYDNMLKRKNKEIERLKQMKIHTEKYASEMEDKYILEKNKNDKAIEYIEQQRDTKTHRVDTRLERVSKILQGNDKE